MIFFSFSKAHKMVSFNVLAQMFKVINVTFKVTYRARNKANDGTILLDHGKGITGWCSR